MLAIHSFCLSLMNHSRMDYSCSYPMIILSLASILVHHALSSPIDYCIRYWHVSVLPYYSARTLIR